MKLRYPAGRQAFGEARLNWAKDDIVAFLVGANYRVSETHRAVADLKAVVHGPVAVENRTITDGFARCNRIRFPGVKGEAKAHAVVIAKRGGVLVAYSDEVANFPVQPNGGDIDVKFEPFIFRL
ncbi:MAG: hypothetical protein EPO27_10550 [Betaproteobacteria bacterium]|nr:MAG: hypothetical protein EPO27_10550 [Betaproteobacteria bacterium]